MWFNNSLRGMRDVLSCIETISGNTKSPEDYSIYNNYRKSYRQALNNAKKSSYNKYITDSDNKQESSWRIINHELKRKPEQQHATDISIETSSNFFAGIAGNLISTLPLVEENPLSFLQPLASSKQ
ncbi:hypothetical protein JTB14_003271 [Gonioctena quinquepunctata]|nr:hypothetical protein JTB14_003271 [Gonioctena quinquepunctata]